MNIEDYIDRYMAGQLSKAENNAFEAILENNPDAQKVVNNYAQIKTLSDDILERELQEQVNSKVYGTASSAKVKRFRQPMAWAAGILFLLGLAVGYYISKQPNFDKQAVLMAFYQRPIDENKVRSTDVSTLDVFAKGKYYFELNDFVKSEQSLRSYIDSSPDAANLTEANYWLGHALFNQHKYQAAGQLFLKSEYKDYQCLHSITQVFQGELESDLLSKDCE